MKMNKILAALCVAGLATPQFANATNGMLMEGYGPIATGMGGASMAYDNGNAGMANNPATLGLMADGSRLDIAVGGLHPSITSTCTTAPCAGGAAESGGTAYYMPAIGWTNKKGGMAYGIGMFAQGGMGTEYKTTDWVGAGSGLESRSEVAVGNVIVPFAYDVSSELTVAGSMDLVWSSMDLKMAMGAAQMGSMFSAGLISVGTPAQQVMVGTFAGGANNVGYFDFSDNSAFTGSAKATGYSGKLGMTYKFNKQLTLGATYHAKTALGDMTSNSGKMLMIDTAGVMGGAAGQTYTQNGKITIVDFQFPETYGLGAAYQATDDLMVAADWKRIGWKAAMKGFRMKFSATDGSLDMDMTMPQNWKDQDVIQVGAAYKLSQALTVRAGVNLATNPVPNDYVNPLFPATVENHITMGAGYAIDNVSSINGSFAYAPKVTVTAPANPGVSPAYTIEHGQMNWQLMYSRSL